jgi:S1-C subfamily serine protease
LTQSQAVLVESIDPSGPAAKGGIEQLDWILSIGGRAIESQEVFPYTIDEFADTEIELRVLRSTGELATKRIRVARLR